MIDVIMVTRPIILIPVWGFSALGFRAALTTSSSLNFRNCWDKASLLSYGSIIIFSFSVAAVYIINQLADIAVDKKNGGLPLIASGIVSVRASILFTIFCSLISLLLPLIMMQPAIAALSLFSLLLGTVYSLRPLRFSGRPFLDFLCNAAGYGIIAFAAGWVSTGQSLFQPGLIRAAIPYFFLMAAGSISSTLPDIPGDRSDGKRTTAVVLGKKRAHILALTCLCLSFSCGMVLHDTVAAGCALLSLPLYGAYLLKISSTALMEAAYKVGGAACMSAAFLSMPLFLILSLVVFLFTMLYFRIRHGVSYPSLVPVNVSPEYRQRD